MCETRRWRGYSCRWLDCVMCAVNRDGLRCCGLGAVEQPCLMMLDLGDLWLVCRLSLAMHGEQGSAVTARRCRKRVWYWRALLFVDGGALDGRGALSPISPFPELLRNRHPGKYFSAPGNHHHHHRVTPDKASTIRISKPACNPNNPIF
ncbi:hypothetical protein P154DRAFT_204428 [Amniculicola lignicola CBS 123094]|uniref:Uncharacterized protein n=1 Tax=Amniculicola lignicola CBS 123094 TaxID=1392246 RepID=A0A6A5WMD6_9PLEO|nr:hypothetical protein P154DRAFT_204428 [Amniculicola lignicola CBS 123094]